MGLVLVQETFLIMRHPYVKAVKDQMLMDQPMSQWVAQGAPRLDILTPWWNAQETGETEFIEL